MFLLKQSTAVTVKIGPFLDETDGKTAETGLTIAQADVRLSMNGGNMAQKTEATSCTHDELGYYDCPLDATDTGTLGRLKLMVHESGALPVWHNYMVVPAHVYDGLVAGSDYLQVDTVQIEGGDATDAVNAACDTALADYDGPTNAEMEARTLLAASYATAAICTEARLAELDAANLPADVDAILADTNELQTDDVPGLIAALNDLSAADVNAEVDTALADYDGPTKAELDTAVADVSVDEIQASALADLFNTDSGTTYAAAVAGSVVKETADNAGGSALTLADIADAVWDEAWAGHVGAGTTGLAISYLYSTVIVRVAQCGDAGSASTIDLDAGASSVNDYYKGQLIAICAGTGSGQSRTCTGYDGSTKIATVSPDWATAPDGDSYFAILNTGSTVPVTLALTADVIADAVWDELGTGHTDAGKAGAKLWTDVPAILADTGTDGVVVAAAAKTGYALASDGLDSVATTEPAGVASNFREMLVQVWRRLFKKAAMTSSELRTYADDGSTVLTTQALHDDGTTQSQGAST